MEELIKYIREKSVRGDCTCGRCIDAPQEKRQPECGEDVYFFRVANNGGDAETLKRLLKEYYPDLERLSKGLSYIEIGGDLGDQGVALQLIGLGGCLGIWRVITPLTFGFNDKELEYQLAGGGLVMCTGINLKNSV